MMFSPVLLYVTISALVWSVTADKCQDIAHAKDCRYWAQTGMCKRNAEYMRTYCKRSCNMCGGGGVNLECGTLPQNDILSKRIIGGEETEPHEWPSICSLQRPGPHLNSINPFCGGTLVKNNQGKYFILSAAHCFFDNETNIPFNKEDITVVCGVHDLEGRDRPNNRQTFGVSRYRYPVRYDNNHLERGWDVAVIWLDNQPSENSYVQAACLPSAGHYDGEHAVAVGWGKSAYGDSTVKLHDLRLTITSDRYCKQRWGTKKKQGPLCGAGRE